MAKSNLHKLSKCGGSWSGSTFSRARHARDGQARADDEGGRRRRRDDEPDDLPEGDRGRRCLRRAADGAARGRKPMRRRSSSQLAVARHRRARCDLLAPGARAERRRTATSRSEVDPTLAYDTRGDLRRGDAAARVDRPAEPLREDPGDEARASARSRTASRDGKQHQRHADLLARSATRRSSRRTSAGSSGSSRAAATRRRSHSVASVLRESRRHRDRQAPRRARRGEQDGRRARPHSRCAAKQAIANAQLAYKLFRERSRSSAGNRSKARARGRSPLWARTWSKNPAYRDVMYVEELIGPTR